MKVILITLGCSKNRVDSEHLLKQIVSAGIEVSANDELSEESVCDAVILNTCGFIRDAKEESINAILEAVKAKKEGRVGKIFVFGCLSQRYGKELNCEIPEVDHFFGAFDFHSLLSALGVTPDNGPLCQRYLTTPSHYAYLKISEGCDRTCAYCAIPLIRGKHISVPMEDLVREAEYLAAAGVKELIVIAQDTTYYGMDLYGKRMLGRLLEKLVQIKGIEWIRIHYSYPDNFPDDVLDIMASSLKLCKYIDIPLQHSSDKVLSMMRRSVDGKQTRELIEKFRKKVPDVVLRTTLIVGHPGEGKREFSDLLDFVKEYRFERLGAFTYSEEEGTYGAEHYKDSISDKVKRERYDELMTLQSGISLEYNRSRVGTDERVIVDSFSDGTIIARSMKESPDVDGEILIDAQMIPAGLIGNFLNVKIIGADEYDLRAMLDVGATLKTN